MPRELAPRLQTGHSKDKFLKEECERNDKLMRTYGQ